MVPATARPAGAQRELLLPNELPEYPAPKKLCASTGTAAAAATTAAASATSEEIHNNRAARPPAPPAIAPDASLTAIAKRITPAIPKSHPVNASKPNPPRRPFFQPPLIPTPLSSESAPEF